MPKPKAVPGQVKEELKKKAQSAQGNLPHLSELAEHFVGIAGGPRSMARMLFAEWTAAKPGSVVRSRILDLIARVWRYSSDTTKGVTDLGILSEEDIDAQLEACLGELSEANDEQPARSEQEPPQPTEPQGKPSLPDPSPSAAPPG